MELRRQEELKQQEELRRQEEVQRRLDEQIRWQRQQVGQLNSRVFLNCDTAPIKCGCHSALVTIY